MQAIDACAAAPRRAKRGAAPTDDDVEAVRRRLFRDAYDLCFASYGRGVKAAAQALRACGQNAPIAGFRSSVHDADTVAEPAAEAASPEWLATAHLAVAAVLRQRQSGNEGRQLCSP